jgi:glutamine synthetase
VRLPRSLSEALEADATVRSWFPPALYDPYLRYKRWEIRTLGDVSPAEQCRRYGEAY